MALRPPRLKIFDVCGHGTPSVEVWKSIPKLENMRYDVHGGIDAGGIDAVEPIITALDGGAAFHHLRDLEIDNLDLECAEWNLLLGSLAWAPCAPHMTSLKFLECDLCPASVATLANLLDAFPMIANLDLRLNRGIGDDGVAVLAQGLLAASRTRLTNLNLCRTRMGDEGLAALGSVIHAGRLEELEGLFIHENPANTDEGIDVLAQVIMGAGQRGLPKLSKFGAYGLGLVNWEGVIAIAFALIFHCPQLEEVNLRGNNGDEDVQDAVDDMVRTTNCAQRLTFLL